MRIFKNQTFSKWAAAENISDQNLSEAVKEISDGLKGDNLGGGIYKKRISRPGEGKSGGYRTIIAFKVKSRSFFLYGFPKSQRANITAKEEKALKKLGKSLQAMSDQKISERIQNGTLEEIL